MKKGLKILLVLICISILGIFVSQKIYQIDTKKQPNIKLMIDLENYTIDELKAFATDNNLKLEINEIYSDDYAKDMIINQNIAKGEEYSSNDTLTVDIVIGTLQDKKNAAIELYKKYNVNELGRIPVMMYHGIHNKKNSDTIYTGGNVDKDGYQRTSEAFREDLEFYYQNNYRMIRLTDYVDGIIDVEIGKSPIILTFDDGLQNNINVTGLDEDGNIIIDPNSAVGILEEFKKKYSDYNVTATFFVNSSLFNQSEYNNKILMWLIENGYDIGNHTATHPDFTKIDITTTNYQVGSVYELLDNIIPNKYVNIVALPFGSPYKKSHQNFQSILSPNYNGKNYQTKATLRVGWESDYSPFSKDFDKTFIKRIRAYDNNGQDFDIAFNFSYLENRKYVSDGDKNTIVIRDSDKGQINDNLELEVITY